MSLPTENAGDSAPAPATGHPGGLYVLFFTEMWERFSYYGMRALLVLYMVNYFKWTQQDASFYYKWYTALVYVTPIAGGFLADRYLGNKRAVIIGAIAMSIGHFLMAIDTVWVFKLALLFLIIGNGMFKPNMSTQVGRLYPQNDARRDGAYTIFYMGINLGAFLSPIVCGWLKQRYGFHYGFGAAGVGMLLGLFTYLGGLRWVRELSCGEKTKGAAGVEADDAPSKFPRFSKAAPAIVWILGGVILLGAVGAFFLGKISFFDMIFAFIAVVAYIAAGLILSRITGAARDRVMAIYILGAFVVLFWFAFEQAGNVMNLWADQTTQRFLTHAPPPASPLPEVAPPVGFEEAKAATAAAPSVWNPVPTEWFQSINALAIFALGLIFTGLWTWLDRRGKNPSIPAKMATGLLLMSAASALMIFSGKAEDKPSETVLANLPQRMLVGADGSITYKDAPDLGKEPGTGEPGAKAGAVPAQFGRLHYKDGRLSMRGVLADVERDRILRATVPPSFVRKAAELALKSAAEKDDKFAVDVTLDEVPPGFDLAYSGIHPKNLHFDPGTKKLTVENFHLADKDYKAVLQAASEPQFREAMNKLYVASQAFKVSPWWLFWFYILCTLGELCLSPVGLSMVSKLAPAKFATMLMGMWLLTSFFGNFLAGQAGELWGTMTPTAYFLMLVAVGGGGAVALFVLLRKAAQKMMHGVN
jgi:POT family proton-dependent oligopeptide transporter